MHEWSTAQNLAELAVEEAENKGIKRVEVLYLRLGALSGVEKDALHFSFDVAVQGTPLEGARLVIEIVPVKVFCPSCREPHVLSEPIPMRCPVCNTRTGQILEGRELELYALKGDGKFIAVCKNRSWEEHIHVPGDPGENRGVSPR